jgi:hypothetical protein
MAKIREKYTDDDHLFYGLEFKCPGCGWKHDLPVTDYQNSKGVPENLLAQKRHHWTFNGNFDQPTFHPSVHWKVGHYVDNLRKDQCGNCTYFEGKGEKSSCGVCHSWVRDGMIEFLNDCTHALAGQTVALPEI